MTLPKVTYSNHNRVPKIAWNRLSESELYQLYTVPLENELHRLYTEYVSTDLGSNDTPIDDLLQRTVQIMIDMSHTNLPVIKTGKLKKPYWSNTLTSLNHSVKAAWRQWVAEGRPRDPDDPVWLQYKEAKRTFRAAQRKAEHGYANKCIDELCNSQQVDQRYFWYLVNKNKRKGPSIEATIDDISGNILYDPDEVNNSWFHYFKALHKPIDKPRYDAHQKVVVEQIISDLSSHDVINDSHVMFTTSQVSAICKTLKKNKAAGWDAIFAEHLMHGGEYMTRILTLIYNYISRHHNVPYHFKKGVIVPIPKYRARIFSVKITTEVYLYFRLSVRYMRNYYYTGLKLIVLLILMIYRAHASVARRVLILLSY